MAPVPEDEGAVRLPRVSIDLKLPLWGILSAAAIGIAGLLSTYNQVARVGEDMQELKAQLKANNSQTIQFAQEQALLRFRVEKLEQSSH